MIGTSLRSCGSMKHWNGVLAISNTNFAQIVSGIGQKRSYAKKGDAKELEKIVACSKEISQTAGKQVEAWPKSDPPPPCWRYECPQDPQPPNYDPYRIKVPDIVVPPLPPSNAKPMLQCARTGGPCSAKPAPDPPPCPPPPPYRFPWIYLWITGAILGLFGLFYKYWLYLEGLKNAGDSVPVWRPRRKTKQPYHEADLPPCVQYLIIGTGAAGWAAYRAIMQHDKQAKVFFVTKEDVLPYRRPPMSKHMWWNMDPPELKTLDFMVKGKRRTMYQAQCALFMDPVKFYRRRSGPAVSIASGWCVLRVDADDHVAWVKTLCGERPIYYERLLLAPGSKPKNLTMFQVAPKNVRDKICLLRTIRDLEIAFRKVKESKNVVIIGAGLLGTELAWHLGRIDREIYNSMDMPYNKVKITLMYKDNGILSSVLPEYLGVWASEKLKCENVTLMSNTQVYDAFESPDGRLQLTLSDGSSFVTDYAFVCVGTKPREELAEPSFLELDKVNGGFKVNTELEARRHVWVAGDAASYWSQWKQQRARVEHLLNAEEQGVVAGANMTGYWIPYNCEPHFWLNLGDALEMEAVGDVGACMPTVGVFMPCKEDEVAIDLEKRKGDADQPCYKKSEVYKYKYKRGILFYLRDETVVGFVFWNFPPIEDRYEVATELLRARPSYQDIALLAELLGFPVAECNIIPPEQKVAAGPCIQAWREF